MRETMHVQEHTPTVDRLADKVPRLLWEKGAGNILIIEYFCINFTGIDMCRPTKTPKVQMDKSIIKRLLPYI